MKQKKLKILLNQIFQKHNLSKDHSKIVSDYLIKAELLDAPSHGLARLKMYCDRIKKKLIMDDIESDHKDGISHLKLNDNIKTETFESELIVKMTFKLTIK